jgi:hypothetical protein
MIVVVRMKDGWWRMAAHNKEWEVSGPCKEEVAKTAAHYELMYSQDEEYRKSSAIYRKNRGGGL